MENFFLSPRPFPAQPITLPFSFFVSRGPETTAAGPFPFSLGPARHSPFPFSSLTDAWDPFVIPDLGEDSDSPRVRVERAPL